MSETITLTASDGHSLDAYLAQPSGKPRGGIVVVQEIFGANSHMRSVADGFAADGYLAIVPALFDRLEKGIELGYDADDVAAGRGYKDQVSFDMALADVAAAQAAVASAGKVGVVGYCWGGTVTWLSACRIEGFSAVSGYYGGGIGNLATEQPKCPTIMHFGEEDHAIPLDEVGLLQAAHADMPVHIYPAGHGFNCEQRGSYEPNSAKIARERTLEHFRANIG